jgi:hypothetical protein
MGFFLPSCLWQAIWPGRLNSLNDNPWLSAQQRRPVGAV